MVVEANVAVAADIVDEVGHKKERNEKRKKQLSWKQEKQQKEVETLVCEMREDEAELRSEEAGWVSVSQRNEEEGNSPTKCKG